MIGYLMARAIFTLLIVAVITHSAPAQTVPASTPATGAAPDLAALEISITGVEGLVQVRDASDAPWRAAKAGMVVSAGAEFRTGPRSAVRCKIPPEQTFTIDRLGTIKVLQALVQNGKVKTDLAMQYGRTRYDVEQAGVEHESIIRSPNGALALRGTQVSLYDQPPFTPRATSLSGRAVFATSKRRMSFGGQGKTEVDEDSESAADRSAKAARVVEIIDPKSALELTEAETRQLAFDVSQGAIRFGRLIIGGFQPPPADLQGAGLLPGKLNFAVTWTGFVDIDLFVILNPGSTNEIYLGNPSLSRLFPGLVHSELPSGARIDFDKISVQSGDFEVAYWPKKNYQGGLFGIGIIHQDFRPVAPKYDAVSKVKFEVFLDGKRLNTVVTNPEAVQDGAPAVLGTAYKTQTDLNTGRNVVATVAFVPAPGTSAGRAPARAKVAGKAAKTAPAQPAQPAVRPGKRGR
jgi:hypothetical protein